MEKSMKKVLRKPLAAGLILSMIVGSLFSGCQSSSSGSAASNSSSAGGDSNQPVTITLMQQNTPDKAYFKTLAQDFMKLNKNVTINIIQVPYEQFDSKLQTMIAAHTQPDITTNVQLMGFKDYYAKGLLTDLTPYIEKYNFDATKIGIPENVMSMATIDNKVYGIPLNTFTTVLMYNKDLFDKAGVAYPPSSYEDKSWTFDKMM
jgi:multiple sugar transport system substrate-binding protein